MGEQIIEFETAKTAKEKGIEVECLHFYAKPKCKVFGIDEEGRPYKSVNRKGVVLMVGESAVLSEENAYYAPTQSHLQTVLRNNYKEHLGVVYMPLDKTYSSSLTMRSMGWSGFKTYEEALEKALFEALKLISYEK